MTQQEKDAVLAGLAARDVASLKALETEDSLPAGDEMLALSKIAKLLTMPWHQAEPVLQQMVQHLQGSDLTINFYGKAFFEDKPKDTYLNAFEKRERTPPYMDTRDETEEFLFNHSNTNRLVGLRKKVTDKASSVMSRVQKFGSYSGGTNPSFAPSIRPKYAALNYTEDKNGGASNYGLSYMVLREHVKHNCTITQGDSFQSLKKRDTAAGNIHHLEGVIARMDNVRLLKLYNVATGSNKPIDHEGVFAYIEAQVHGEIRFNRDVKAIYISNTEIAKAAWNIKWTIGNFARKNGIALKYIV